MTGKQNDTEIAQDKEDILPVATERGAAYVT